MVNYSLNPNPCGCDGKREGDCPTHETVIELTREISNLRKELAECSPPPKIDRQLTINTTSFTSRPWKGFGASFAGSGQYVFLDPAFDETRDDMTRILFSETEGIGLDIARVHIGAGELPAPSYGDPSNNLKTHEPEDGVIDWTTNDGQIAAVQSALSHNAGVKVLASCWSPPGWLKTNGNDTGQHDDGTPAEIIPGGIPRFAQYLRTYLDHYSEGGPYKVDYFSPINEPSFAPAGIGSWWTVENVGALNAELATALDGWDGELLSPEEAAYSTTVSTVDYLRSNAEALTGWGAVDSVATHFYNPDITRVRREAAGDLARITSEGRPVYMTEITMTGYQLPEAMDLAEYVHWYMTTHDADMFLYWLAFQWVTEFAGALNGSVALLGVSDQGDYRPNKKYYALGQYSRFIRPGWRAVSVTGDTTPRKALDTDGGLFATTYAAPDRSRTATVVVNRGARQTVRITGLATEIVEIVVTDETRDMETIAVLDAPYGSAVVNIPANSIVTIADKVLT